MNRARHAEAQRRYRARHYARVRKIEKRYQRSAKGKVAYARNHRKYRDTPKGKAATLRYAQGRGREWLQTPQGKRYVERHNLRLPPFAPVSLIRAIRLLGALQQEIRT